MVKIALLFFLSGHSAILYQIIWQRSLFTIFGTNIESVTAVVAAFMLGLGLGSFAGGRLSRLWPNHLLLLFAGLEITIGIFGLVSLALFASLGRRFAGMGMVETGMAAFLLVLAPTLLMGATLPLLSAWLVPRLRHVGKGVGMLYAINTLGSASACFVATEFVLGSVGQLATVSLAGVLNLAVGSAALWLHRQGERMIVTPDLSWQPESDHPLHTSLPEPSRPNASYYFFAGLAGFISLSLEILWMRAYSFLSGGSAKDFGHLLGFFLIGITVGSLLGRKITARPLQATDRRWILAVLVATASLWSFLSFPAMVWIAGLNPTGFWHFLSVPATGTAPAQISSVATLVVVGFGAALWATLLPVISHFTLSPDGNAGSGLGKLYLMNILGSVAGSLLTGFVLMDHFETSAIAFGLTTLGLLAATQPWLTTTSAPGRPAVLIAIFSAWLGLVALQPSSMGNLYQNLFHHGRTPPEGQQFKDVTENRSGVIAVTREGTVYGGGVYDGRISIDFINDTNGIFRPFALAAFHPHPKRVLMIGLAGGAWAQVIGNQPDVEELLVVEINPGYIDLVRRTPAVSSILKNPKIKIIIDDGRRWVTHHPQERFDAIVMNTTWNWRAFISNLLSREFLTQLRNALQPDGVLMFNATGSRQAQRTAAVTFPHAMRFSNLMVASNAPLNIDLERWQQSLSRHAIDGQPVVDDSPAALQAISTFRKRFQDIDLPKAKEWNSTESRQFLLDNSIGNRIITDDNMGTEWLSRR
ncbi:MAG: spermidine synthase [Magnetococcales bacterium]|nr:spermidine synthase [Magnetococcales bacterium]